VIPGRLLHRLAACICIERSLARVVEPAIADFQKEYADVALHPPFTRAQVLLSGYVGAWEGIAMTALETSPRAESDRSALMRALFAAAVATISSSALLIALTIAGTPVFAPFYIALLTPMTLPIALPIGLTLGIAFGLHNRGASRRARQIVLVSAVLVTALSFASMAYIKPVANQMFRQSVFNAIGGHGVVMKGLHEMSVSELEREGSMAPRGEMKEMPQRARWVYHLVFALPLAPLVLAVFALVLIGRDTRRATVMGICVGYYVVLLGTEELVYGGFPPAIAAWSPNVIFVVAATCFMLSRPSNIHDPLSPER
jgi:hypothetical protein